jgi:spore coat polysaccharide biosynthesis protein SpsF
MIENNIIAIIQARLGSSRLPAKVLLNLKGKSVIRHVAERTMASNLINKTYVATTILDDDLKIVEECSKNGINVFCGSENDVLDRYYQLSKLLKPKHIVRITADCPLIDPGVIDFVIKEHIKEDADYTSNTLEIPYPDGQDVEVFKFQALEKAYRDANLLSEREHVTPYIKFDEKNFKINKILSTEKKSNYRWTLDEKEDFDLIKIIFDELYDDNHFFSMDDIIKFLEKNKKLLSINSMYLREEGYRKSIENDKIIGEL